MSNIPYKSDTYTYTYTDIDTPDTPDTLDSDTPDTSDTTDTSDTFDTYSICDKVVHICIQQCTEV